MSDVVTERIIGAAIEVHRTFGAGLLESVYEAALCHEMSLIGIPFQRQVRLDVHYKGSVIAQQVLDIVVDKSVIVELKSVQHLPDIATAQILSYLKATGLERGLLINFSAPRLVQGIKRFSL
ncbi:MAG TPA: GxxExxY protein [bacterium]|nr:GxxExxY protein [bacterium]